MKKWIICIVVFALACNLLTSCGKEEKENNYAQEKAAQSSEQESSPVVESKAETSAEESLTEESEASEVSESVEESEEAEPEGYGPLCFAVGDFSFGILDSVDDVIAVIGDPLDTFTAASCAYQGDDYFYYYDGFEFTGNIIDDVNRIISITLDDDTVCLPQGVKIGMDISEAVELVNVSMGGSEDELKYTVSGSNYAFVCGPCTLLIQAGPDDCVKAVQFVRTME